MRCSCPECDTYMVQADDLTMGCVCPWCLHRCNACLGTNTVFTPQDIKNLEARIVPPDFSEPEDEEY
ncbi:MAG: hypothetical protein IJP03_03630 [Christensenellaceae bacterium]|nr:hypothetical protein [Christensenellaceae bacterium]